MYKIPYAGAEVEKIPTAVKVDARPIDIPPCPKSLKDILLNVCRELEVHPNDVVGKGREPKLVLAREEFIWRARCNTLASFPRIAKIINRDHSTAIYHFYYRKARTSGVNPPEKWKRKALISSSKDNDASLSERQEAVRQLMLKGYNNYEISAALGVSTTMVKIDKRAIKIFRPLPEWFVKGAE